MSHCVGVSTAWSGHENGHEDMVIATQRTTNGLHSVPSVQIIPVTFGFTCEFTSITETKMFVSRMLM